MNEKCPFLYELVSSEISTQSKAIQSPGFHKAQEEIACQITEINLLVLTENQQDPFGDWGRLF